MVEGCCATRRAAEGPQALHPSQMHLSAATAQVDAAAARLAHCFFQSSFTAPPMPGPACNGNARPFSSTQQHTCKLPAALTDVKVT